MRASWLRDLDFSSSSGSRYVRAISASLSTMGARVVASLTGLIITPLLLNDLGEQQFALWMTISSAMGVLGFSDLGLGQGLLTTLSKPIAEGDRKAQASLVSSAIVMLSGVALLLGSVFVLVRPHVAWDDLLGFGAADFDSLARSSVTIFLTVYLLGVPLLVVERTRLAFQEGYKNGIWQMVGHVLSLGMVVILVANGASLPVLILALTGGTLATNLINGSLLFLRDRPWLLPRLSSFSGCTGRVLLRLGGWYLVIQIASGAGFASDTLVASHLLGADAVNEYSIALRLFLVGTLVSTIGLVPLWPAYGEAIAAGDFQWARGALRRSALAAGALTGGVSLLLVAFGPWFVDLWLGSEIQPDRLLLLAFGVWMTISSLGSAYLMVLNGAQIVRFQAVVLAGMTVTNIGLSLALAPTLGIAGIVLSSAIAYFFLVLLPTAWKVRVYLGAQETEGTKEVDLNSG